MKFSGKGKTLSVDACGISTVYLNDYHVEDASIKASCASSLVVNAGGGLDVDAAQNAQVYFVSKPAVGDLNVHENASTQPK